jgi:hypothetical protein
MTRGAVALLPKALVTWAVLAVVMFANGTLRALVLQPHLGEQLARQVATGSGVIIVFAAAFLLVRGLEAPSGPELLKVGALWLVLTLSFEFGMGLVAGTSWDEMLADYDVRSGRLWPLIPLSALVAPWIWGALGVRRRDDFEA